MNKFIQDQGVKTLGYVDIPRTNDAGIEEICHIPSGSGSLPRIAALRLGVYLAIFSPQRALCVLVKLPRTRSGNI